MAVKDSKPDVKYVSNSHFMLHLGTLNSGSLSPSNNQMVKYMVVFINNTIVFKDNYIKCNHVILEFDWKTLWVTQLLHQNIAHFGVEIAFLR
jgi:hypothetical protein